MVFLGVQLLETTTSALNFAFVFCDKSHRAQFPRQIIAFTNVFDIFKFNTHMAFFILTKETLLWTKQRATPV